MGRMPFSKSEKLYCNITDILNLSDKKTQKLLDIIIYDDRLKAKEEDASNFFRIINECFPNHQSIRIKNLICESYDEMCKYDTNNIIKEVTLRDYDTKLKESSIPIICDEKDFSKIKRDNINKISKAVTNMHDEKDLMYGSVYFDPLILDNETFIKSLDYIAMQIKENAKNDVQKVLLINKFLKENIVFDWDYKDDKLWKSLNEEARKEGFAFYPSHAPQALLLKRKGVCSSFARFVTILLNHPLININTKTLDGNYGEYGHSYNEIILDGKKYTCDFTHNTSRDKGLGLKFLFVKRPSDMHTLNSGDFEEYETMPRDLLLREYDKIKDIKINMPEFKEAEFKIKYADLDDVNKKYAELIKSRNIM